MCGENRYYIVLQGGIRDYFKRFLNFTEKYLAGFSMDWEDMVDLCVVGDVMLDRGVKEGVKDRGYQCLFEETNIYCPRPT